MGPKSIFEKKDVRFPVGISVQSSEITGGTSRHRGWNFLDMSHPFGIFRAKRAKNYELMHAAIERDAMGYEKEI